MVHGLLGILGPEPLKLVLGPLVVGIAFRVVQNRLANSAPELEAFMSTTRAASTRGFGGSQSKSDGVLPDFSARQNAFSAAVRMLW